MTVHFLFTFETFVLLLSHQLISCDSTIPNLACETLDYDMPNTKWLEWVDSIIGKPPDQVVEESHNLGGVSLSNSREGMMVKTANQHLTLEEMFETVPACKFSPEQCIKGMRAQIILDHHRSSRDHMIKDNLALFNGSLPLNYSVRLYVTEDSFMGHEISFDAKVQLKLKEFAKQNGDCRVPCVVNAHPESPPTGENAPHAFLRSLVTLPRSESRFGSLPNEDHVLGSSYNRLSTQPKPVFVLDSEVSV